MFVAEIPPFEPFDLHAMGAEFGKQGVFVDLYSPASIIAEMEMEFIELVVRHLVQNLEYLLFGEEVA